MDQLLIECKFFVIASEIDEFIELLEREGYTEQAKCVKLQFEQQIADS